MGNFSDFWGIFDIIFPGFWRSFEILFFSWFFRFFEISKKCPKIMIIFLGRQCGHSASFSRVRFWRSFEFSVSRRPHRNNWYFNNRRRNNNWRNNNLSIRTSGCWNNWNERRYGSYRPRSRSPFNETISKCAKITTPKTKRFVISPVIEQKLECSHISMFLGIW